MEGKTNVLGILGLIFGIISIPFFWLWYVGAPFGIAGLILSIIGKKNPNGRGLATTGMILSIIGLALFLIVYLIIMVLLAALFA